jgi:hypothetical protein
MPVSNHCNSLILVFFIPMMPLKDTTLRGGDQVLTIVNATLTKDKEKSRVKVHLQAAGGADVATLDLPKEQAWNLIEHLSEFSIR